MNKEQDMAKGIKKVEAENEKVHERDGREKRKRGLRKEESPKKKN